MEFKISFCIVSMNRLHHLKKTLMSNIQDNEDYKNLEFVVLNYNSKDKMDEWIKENVSKYIESGKLTYYHTFDPTEFNHSHAKNMAFKLAKGDILCSINADHFSGKNFANYVNRQFNLHKEIVLTTIDYDKKKKNYFPPQDILGKVCVKKRDFINVNGFDESMTNYGFEDYDFINRLELNKVKRKLITNLAYMNFISHSHNEKA